MMMQASHFREGHHLAHFWGFDSSGVRTIHIEGKMGTKAVIIGDIRSRGRKGGRCPKLSAEQQQLAADMARGGIPITTIASTFQCSRHTIYKVMRHITTCEQPVR